MTKVKQQLNLKKDGVNMVSHEDKDIYADEIDGFSSSPPLPPLRKVPKFDWDNKDGDKNDDKDATPRGRFPTIEDLMDEDLMNELDAKMEAGEEFYLGGTVLNPKYLSLHSELMDSYRQSSEGKGRERHANDEPFEQQKILVIQRWIGNSPVGGLIFQAAKKTIEASRLEPEAAIHELSGATVYLQAAKIRLRELLKEAK